MRMRQPPAWFRAWNHRLYCVLRKAGIRITQHAIDLVAQDGVWVVRRFERGAFFVA